MTRPRPYGAGRHSPRTLTDAQIRALRRRIYRNPEWGGGGSTRRFALRSISYALKSRIYRGAVHRICTILNEEEHEAKS